MARQSIRRGICSLLNNQSAGTSRRKELAPAILVMLAGAVAHASAPAAAQSQPIEFRWQWNLTPPALWDAREPDLDSQTWLFARRGRSQQGGNSFTDGPINSHWAVPTSGNWMDAARWDTPSAPSNNTPPGTSYNAVIDALGPAYTIMLDTDVTVDSLTLDASSATLHHDGGTLTLDQFDLVSGEYRMTGGTLKGGTLNLAGGSIWLQSNLSNRFAGMTINGDLETSGGFGITDGLTLDGTLRLKREGLTGYMYFDGTQTLHSGTIIFDATPGMERRMSIQPESTLTLAPGTVIRGGNAIIGGAMFSAFGERTLANHGLISADADGFDITIVEETLVANHGTLEAVGGGRLHIHNLQGNVNEARADGAGSLLRLGGSYTNNLALNVSDGAMLALEGDWNNTGSINLSGESFLHLGGEFSAADIGTINRGDGTMRLTGELDNQNSTFTLNETTGPWQLAGGTVLGGTLNLDGVTMDTWGSETGTFDGVAFNGTVNVLEGTYLRLLGDWQNNGTINLNSGTLELGGAFDNAALGTVNRDPASGGLVLLTGAMDNTGGVLSLDNVAGPWRLRGSIEGGAVHTSGAGRLEIEGHLAELTDVSFHGDMLFQNNSRLAGAGLQNHGSITVSGNSILTLSDDWANTGTITLGNGSAELWGEFTTAEMGNINRTGLSSSTLRIRGTLDNTGNVIEINPQSPNWTLHGGTMVGGAVNIDPGQTLWVGQTTMPPTPSLNRLDGVTVSGEIALSGQETILAVSSDTILNSRVRVGGGTVAFEGDYTFDGTLVGTAGGSVMAGAVTAEPGRTLTLGPDALVEGRGLRLGERSGSGPDNALVNLGTIRADRSGSSLPIVIAADATTNLGKLEAVGGGTLIVQHLVGNLGDALVQGQNSTLVLDGTYTNDQVLSVTGGGILDLRGQWNNTGTITATDSTVHLGGAFSMSELGNFERSGGTVRLTGTLDNSQSTLTLNSTTGSWDLYGGTIAGGNVDLLDGTLLRTAGSMPSRLSGATVNGPVNIPESELVMDSGASLSGTTLISGGILSYEGSSLINDGVFTFEGSRFGELRVLDDGGAPVTLTIGSGAEIRGGNGRLGSHLASSQDDTIINQGLISADVPGRELNIRSKEFINEGIIEARDGGVLSLGRQDGAFTWSNNGLIRLIDSTLSLGGTFSVGELGNFEQTNSSVDITGTLLNEGNVLSLNAATGQWNLRSRANDPSPTIVGGTVETGQGVRLGIRGNGTSILDNVTFNGGLDVQSNVRLVNGTTTPMDAYFQGGSLFVPDGTIIEGAEYIFDGPRGTTTQTSSRLLTDQDGPAGTLTIGPNTILRGYGLRLGQSLLSYDETVINQGLISADLLSNPTSTAQLTITPSTFINEGTIEARNDSRLHLSLNYNAGGFNTATEWSNTGLIRAIDGRIELGGRTSTADLGLIEREPNGTIIFNGELINTGASLVVDSQRDFTSFAGRLIGGTLVGPQGRTFPLTGQLVGVETISGDFRLSGDFEGGLNLDGTATIPSRLTALDTQSISGGTYLLDGGEIRTSRDETLTLAPSAVVEGRGTLGVHSSPIFGIHTLVNHGIVRANVPNQILRIGPNSFTNHGLLEAVNGGNLTFGGNTEWVHQGELRVAEGGTAQLGGTFSVVGGSLVNDGGTLRITGLLNNQHSTLTVGGAMGDIELRGTIAGGTVESTGQGRLVTHGGELRGVTLNSNVHATAGLSISEGLDGTGTITTDGSSGLDITVRGTSSTFDGGNFVLSGPSAGTPDRMTFVLPPSDLTLGPAVTVRGGHAMLFDHAASGGTLVNHGLISANQEGKMLTIAADQFENFGTVEAVDGGILNIAAPTLGMQGASRARNWSGSGTVRVVDSTLRLGGTFPTSALDNFERTRGNVELHGTLDNRNAVLTLDGPNQSWSMGEAGLGNLYDWVGARIQGGTVNLLNGAELHVEPLSGLILDSTNLNGSLDVHGRLFSSPGTSVAGSITLHQGSSWRLFDPERGPMELSTGELIFAGTQAPAPNVFGDDVRVPAGTVVRGGSGTLRTTQNHGTISADVAGAVINLGAETWVNHGVAEAINEGRLALGGNFSSPGTIRVTDGELLVGGRFTTAGFGGFDRTGGTVTFNRYIDNADSALNLDGFEWVMDNAYVRHGAINMTGGASLLLQGQPTTFNQVSVTGTVNLLDAGTQLTVRDAIDLTGQINLAGPDSRLHFIGQNAAISGGTITFDAASGGGDREISGLNHSTLMFAPNVTVHGGRGTIRTSETSTIINQGLISADVNNETITIYTARFQNEGTLEAINGGKLELIPPGIAPFEMHLVNLGVVDPGPRALELSGPFTQTETGTLRATITRERGSLAHTQLVSWRDVEIDGTLEVVLAGGFQPWPGMQVQLFDIDFAQLRGDFAHVQLPALAAENTWDLSGLYTTGQISVIPSPGPSLLVGAGLIVMARRRRKEASR